MKRLLIRFGIDEETAVNVLKAVAVFVLLVLANGIGGGVTGR